MRFLRQASVDADQWGWACGFYSGVEPAQHRQGSAATFDEGTDGI
jgi:hypothetical protein